MLTSEDLGTAAPLARVRLARRSPHTRAILQALLVTFLWSTSWVLIKIGLRDIPALSFAGLRYTLGFLVLVPVALRAARSPRHRPLTRRDLAILALLGLLQIAVTQGAQFLGLKFLPAITVSLLFNCTPMVVVLLGMAFLSETPTARQWLGLAIYLGGTLLYFYPAAFHGSEILALMIMVVGVVTNAVSSVLGRHVNRQERLAPLTVTVVSMGFGSIALLVAGVTIEGLPTVSPAGWAIIAWLAVVNTALAFTIWNVTLRTLSAMESSLINGTMLVQIAALAWIFLGESLDWQRLAGMALVAAGALLVQLRAGSRQAALPTREITVRPGDTTGTPAGGVPQHPR